MQLTSDDILSSAAEMPRHDVEDLIEGLIDTLDARDGDGDCDLEAEIDCGADDFGEPEGATWTERRRFAA